MLNTLAQQLRKRHHKEDGTTLAEMLVGISLMTLIGTMATSAIISTYTYQSVFTLRSTAQNVKATVSVYAADKAGYVKYGSDKSFLYISSACNEDGSAAQSTDQALTTALNSLVNDYTCVNVQGTVDQWLIRVGSPTMDGVYTVFSADTQHLDLTSEEFTDPNHTA